ncbi:MAG: HAMP domain-containing histidine kinase [Oscillospiraceae bacterium]|nr:HAMP domain-containing histidine kinase [Oscillospiraceae bacterium]
MKRVRSRLTILLSVIVIASSLVSLSLYFMLQNGFLIYRDSLDHLLFGLVLRDVLLLIVAYVVIVVAILVTSRTTTNPIMELNRATKAIAEGNFDVELSIQDRVEEFGELQRNFNRMVQELKNNEFLRKDFTTNVSHELKTPLSIIEGYAKLLSEDDLPDSERKEYAGLIAREASRLSRLTTDMLRLSRLDNQEILPPPKVFQLDEQLRQAVLLLEPKWSEKNLEVDLSLPPVLCQGDEELLSHVWANLLDNAVKFSEEGGVLSVSLEETEEEIIACIRDSGIGMSPETLARIFEPFYQGDTACRHQGSGLGLTLVKRIIERSGGTIRVDSAPGQGTVFTVTLIRHPLPEIETRL